MVGGAGFGGVALQGVGAGEAEMRECAQWEVQCDSSVVEKLLKLGGCGSPIVGR